MKIVFRLIRKDTKEELATYESPFGAIRTYKELLMPKFQKKYLKGISVVKEGKTLKSVKFEKTAKIECIVENHLCFITTEESESATRSKLTWDQFVMRMGLPDSLLIPVKK